jgi:hypothetical protein
MRLILLAILLISQYTAFSQFTYVLADSIKVSENGNLIKAALAGGFNSPQFNEIDLDGDGKMDLVVFDRAGDKVVTYLNTGSAGVISYEYAPKYIPIFPQAYKWIKLIDYDCDGMIDLFRNDGGSDIVVHKNIGTIGNNQFRIKENLYVKGTNPLPFNLNSAPEDIPGVADIDGDGDIDFLTFGSTQLSYQKNVSMDSLGICGLKFEYRNYCWGRFSEGGFDDQVYLDSCRHNNITNPENTGNTKGTPINIDKHSGSTVTLFDFDNQNGIDVLLGDVSSTTVKRLINGDFSSNFKSSRIVKYDRVYPPDSLNRNIMPTFPSTYIQDFNNDGKKDLILTVNTTIDTNSLNANNVRLFLNTGTLGNPNFEYLKSDFLQDEILDFGMDALPTFFDYNNDGLMDIVVGNTSYYDDSLKTDGRLALLKNVGAHNNPKFDLIDRNYLQIDTLQLIDRGRGATQRLSTAFGDLDADGDQDLIIGDFEGKLHYFENIATPGAEADFRLVEKNYQKIELTENANPRIIDLDKDGKVDLVVGSKFGNLNFFRNRGTNVNPIFNLKIDSIVWEGNYIFKYYLEGNPDLSGLIINERYEIIETKIPANRGSLYLTDVNQTNGYLKFRNYIIDSDTINEKGNGYINVVYDSIGNVSKHISNFKDKPTNNSQPLFYEYQGKLQLLSPTNEGKLKAFTDIDSNIYGSFTFTQDNALNIHIGHNLSGDVYDLNNDGKIDLVLGNQSGGITIFYGDGFVGIDNDHANFESSTKTQLKIFPNPTKGEFNLLLSDFEEGKAYQVKVFDLVGKLVFEKTILREMEQLDLSQQNKGVYFIQLHSDGKVSKAEKLIMR